jgi:hypothetical protein
MVTIFTLIFSILALLTMRVAVLQNATKLREYNVSRTFYAADATIEYAAWLMAWIPRGDALSAAELTDQPNLGAPRKRAGFPSQLPRWAFDTDSTNPRGDLTAPAAESIIGVHNAGINGGNTQTFGDQRIFGDPGAADARRTIPFAYTTSLDSAVPAAVNVPVWYPMGNPVSPKAGIPNGYYQFDDQDTQQPVVYVRCRVEREDVMNNPFDPMTAARSPRPIDGYYPTPTNLPSATLTLEVLKEADAPGGGRYGIYKYNGIYYISAPMSALNANFITFINTLNVLPNRIIAETRFYVIIAEAMAEDATSPNYPFKSSLKFHYVVIKTQTRNTTAITSTNVGTIFQVFPNQFVAPGVERIPGNTIIRMINSSDLYGNDRFHSVFRSRR